MLNQRPSAGAAPTLLRVVQCRKTLAPTYSNADCDCVRIFPMTYRYENSCKLDLFLISWPKFTDNGYYR